MKIYKMSLYLVIGLIDCLVALLTLSGNIYSVGALSAVSSIIILFEFYQTYKSVINDW